MLTDKQLILEMLDTSFLPDKEKQALRKLLENGEQEETFFVAMNDALVNEVKRRGGVYEKTMRDLEDGFGSLKDRYLNKRQELDEAKDQRISGVEIDDFAGKRKILDVYYKDVELAQSDYEKSVKDLYSRTYISAMKEVV